MAELLDHLGLDAALRDLCVQARDSIDEEMRKVAEDFSSGVRMPGSGIIKPNYPTSNGTYAEGRTGEDERNGGATE
ncbi:hypothetical protein AB0L85_27320 [Streptomyces sp. NPDC052051]|uniref:hypothetical protein n=1 Tax=Streptomyces sp. NPDC052051 TaxID=3154649 RepID=UPI00342BE13F